MLTRRNVLSVQWGPDGPVIIRREKRVKLSMNNPSSPWLRAYMSPDSLHLQLCWFKGAFYNALLINWKLCKFWLTINKHPEISKEIIVCWLIFFQHEGLMLWCLTGYVWTEPAQFVKLCSGVRPGVVWCGVSVCNIGTPHSGSPGRGLHADISVCAQPGYCQHMLVSSLLSLSHHRFLPQTSMLLLHWATLPH